MLPRDEGHSHEVDHREGLLYIRSNRDARDVHNVTAPLADPQPANCKPFADHRPGVRLQDLEVLKDDLVVNEKPEVLARFCTQNITTGSWCELPFNDPADSAASGQTPAYDSADFHCPTRVRSRCPASPTST